MVLSSFSVHKYRFRTDTGYTSHKN